MTEEQMKQAQEAMRQAQEQQLRDQAKLNEAGRLAQMRQKAMDEAPRQKYAVIVAVDLLGGFSKAGEIPWNYPEDFKWFKDKTMGQICVMGRATYDGITEHLGDKAGDEILPGRRSFVVTSTPLPKDNATVVPNLSAVDALLSLEELDKTIFFIGGESIYNEGISKADLAYVTVVNKDDIGCDRFFPTEYLLKHFNIANVHSHPDAPDLRFLTYKRK